MIVTAIHTSKADTKITGKTNLSLNGALFTRVPLIFKHIKKSVVRRLLPTPV